MLRSDHGSSGYHDLPATSPGLGRGSSQPSKSLPTKSRTSNSTYIMEDGSKCSLYDSSQTDSSQTDRSHAWSRSVSHASTAATSHISVDHHDPQAPELRRNPIAATSGAESQHMYAALAENEALRDSIVELERERTRLQEILNEHKTQQQRDPHLCRCLSPEKRQNSAP